MHSDLFGVGFLGSEGDFPGGGWQGSDSKGDWKEGCLQGDLQDSSVIDGGLQVGPPDGFVGCDAQGALLAELAGHAGRFEAWVPGGRLAGLRRRGEGVAG